MNVNHWSSFDVVKMKLCKGKSPKISEKKMMNVKRILNCAFIKTNK